MGSRSEIARKAWETRHRKKKGFYRRHPPKTTVVDVEEEAYQKARIQTEKALASGKTKVEIERQIDSALLQLQGYALFSTKGGFGGAPDYEKVQGAMRALKRLKADLKKGKIR